MRPAWSQQFDRHRLPRTSPLELDSPITREWAWGGSTGSGVRVAVIDSGIDASHPAVGSVQGGVVVELDGNGKVQLTHETHTDLFGHGTACAGIIRMIAPDAEIYSVRVLGSRLSGQGAVFTAGLRWAIDNGMNIVNLSLGTSKREHFAELHELSDLAYFRRTTLVSAVNNLPVDSYPSQYASVISVAAHGGKDPFRFDYNPSPPVEFGAPGIDIEVPWLRGQTIRATGNSFAAAHISGLVALVLSRHPHATPFQVKTVLQALADNALPDKPWSPYGV
ncbi:S8 family peptidase [Flindersiella endophytica]